MPIGPIPETIALLSPPVLTGLSDADAVASGLSYIANVSLVRTASSRPSVRDNIHQIVNALRPRIASLATWCEEALANALNEAIENVGKAVDADDWNRLESMSVNLMRLSNAVIVARDITEPAAVDRPIAKSYQKLTSNWPAAGIAAIDVGIDEYKQIKAREASEGSGAVAVAWAGWQKRWVEHSDDKIAMFFRVFCSIQLHPVREAAGLNVGSQSSRTERFTDELRVAQRLGIADLPEWPAEPFADAQKADAAYSKLLTAVRASIEQVENAIKAVHHGELQKPVEQAISPADQAGAAEQVATDSADFTTVNWFGKEYAFALGVQSSAVKALWGEWKVSGLGLHQGTICKAVDAERNSFRMDKAFRGNLALGTMIQSAGDGKYKLVKPSDGPLKPAAQIKKSARIPAKARQKPR